MKKLTVIIAVLLSVAIFAGCTEQGTKIASISLEAAKSAAAEKLELDAEQIVFESIEFKTYNGKEYYEIEFKADGKEYECNVDALTGAIISFETPSGYLPDEQPNSTENQQVTEVVQKTESAAENQKAAEPQNTAESQNVTQVQNTEATKDKKDEFISADKAKQIALEHAGVSAKDVVFIKAEFDRDDGRKEYDVEFYSGNVEYDYEIDAVSGAVLSADRDIENYSPVKENNAAQNDNVNNSNTQSGNADSGNVQNNTQGSVHNDAIGADTAKKLALAQVPGATEADIREFETDRDDGRIEYEGKIVYSGIEYEFEIDGHSGAFRKWETEKADRDDHDD